MPEVVTIIPDSEDLEEIVRSASRHSSNVPEVADDEPLTRIVPERKRKLVDWSELKAYRDLLLLFVLRDVTVRYKQTILGLGWAVIRPVMSTVVFTIVFGRVAGIASDGVPYALFAFVAMLPWTYFSTTLSMSSNSLVTNAHLITKVYFPRLIIPAAPTIGNLVDLLVASTLLAVMMVWYGVAPTINIVFLPLLILLLVGATLGAGLWLSAMAIQYRDVNHAMQFVIQLGMFVAPVAWPVAYIEQSFGPVARLLYGIYPLAGIIEGFRSSILGTVAMPWDLIGIGSISTLVVFITGLMYFRRMERVFADVA